MRSFIWRLVVCLLLCSAISVAVKAFPPQVQPIQQQLIQAIASGEMAPQNLSLKTLMDLMHLTKRLGGVENEGVYETLLREYKRRTPPPPIPQALRRRIGIYHHRLTPLHRTCPTKQPESEISR